MPRLSFQRDRGWADSLRAYRILVDGVPIGTLREGEVLDHEVPPGTYVVQARIDWCRSKKLRVTDGACVEVRSSLRGWRVVLALFIVLFLPHRYLRLRRLDAGR